jgi:hypothetical protein
MVVFAILGFRNAPGLLVKAPLVYDDNLVVGHAPTPYFRRFNMPTEIHGYAFFWQAKNNEGTLQLKLSNGEGAQVLVDSAQEGLLLLDILRNEKPVYFDRDNDLIMTGLEPVGEGES